jgi:hypothetical protein
MRRAKDNCLRTARVANCALVTGNGIVGAGNRLPAPVLTEVMMTAGAAGLSVAIASGVGTAAMILAMMIAAMVATLAGMNEKLMMKSAIELSSTPSRTASHATSGAVSPKGVERG